MAHRDLAGRLPASGLAWGRLHAHCPALPVSCGLGPPGGNPAQTPCLAAPGLRPPHEGTHQAGRGQKAVDPGDAPHALQALLGLDGDRAERPAQASRRHRHLDAGPHGPGQPLPPVRRPPGRARHCRSIPRAGHGAGASMRGVQVLPAGGGLQQPQGLPRELVQVGGADGAAALSLRVARRQGPGHWELVEQQSREARVLGKKGQCQSPGARPAAPPSLPVRPRRPQPRILHPPQAPSGFTCTRPAGTQLQEPQARPRCPARPTSPRPRQALMPTRHLRVLTTRPRRRLQSGTNPTRPWAVPGSAPRAPVRSHVCSRATAASLDQPGTAALALHTLSLPLQRPHPSGSGGNEMGLVSSMSPCPLSREPGSPGRQAGGKAHAHPGPC